MSTHRNCWYVVGMEIGACWYGIGFVVFIAGRTLTYKAYNRVNTLAQGADTFTYSYGPENQRYKQVKSGSSSNTTLYINDPIAGMMEEVYTAGGTTTYRDYQMLNGKVVSSRYKIGASTYVWRYYITDSLGSTVVPTKNLIRVS